MVRIKICGITNPRDASLAVELGADALGFIFAPSPRQVTPEEVRSIIAALPPFIQTVGVFVDEDLATVQRIIDFCGLDLVQLHGDELPGVCHELMPRTIKTFRLKDESSLAALRPYRGCVKAFLFDTYSEDRKGGTGRTFDWELAVRGKGLGIPVILAGGLSPSNIQEAVLAVKPYAIDVNSGIEESPGRKSPVLMKRLIHTLRRMDGGGLNND
jgi:phosphoribosylanthranilate isomerase